MKKQMLTSKNIKEGNTILFNLLTIYYKFTFNKRVEETTRYTFLFVCFLLLYFMYLVVLVALVGHLGQQIPNNA